MERLTGDEMTLVATNNSFASSQQILNYTKASAPAIILAVFLVAIVGHGLLAAPTCHDAEVLGPGGRPLPKRRQSTHQVNEAAKTRDFTPSTKLLFNWLGLSALMTFAANALLIVLQVIAHREKWWPGQAAVVSPSPTSSSPG
jgi:ATP-binding cassette, subfamily B, vacuolar membrane transporter HMT1/ACLQ